MGNHMGMLGRAVGRKQVLLTDLFEKKNLPYTQEAFEKVNPRLLENIVRACVMNKLANMVHR
jgi:amidase